MEGFAAAAGKGANTVNTRGPNIFNGLFRVPVNEKIPALNLI
jgi:hypothetical protein